MTQLNQSLRAGSPNSEAFFSSADPYSNVTNEDNGQGRPKLLGWGRLGRARSGPYQLLFLNMSLVCASNTLLET
jgi:hypothetical protein